VLLESDVGQFGWKVMLENDVWNWCRGNWEI